MTCLQCKICKNFFLNEDILTCPECKSVYEYQTKKERNESLIKWAFAMWGIQDLGRRFGSIFFN